MRVDEMIFLKEKGYDGVGKNTEMIKLRAAFNNTE